MATPPKPRQAAGSRQQAARTGGPQRQQGIYVYGIVPAEVELGAGVPVRVGEVEDAKNVGDLVRLIEKRVGGS